MQNITIASIYVRGAIAGAIKKGYNAEDILQAQGLPAKILTSPKLRISAFAFAELSRVLSQLLRDESLGLLVKPQKLGSFNLIAKACLSSRNMQESLEVWRDIANYMNSSTTAFTRFEKEGGYIAISCEKAEGITDNYILENQLTSCHRFHCWLAGEFIPIERVDLNYPKPDFSDEHRFVFYGAPVHYNQKRNALHFSRRSLQLENHRNRDDLQELFKEHHFNILTQSKHGKTASLEVRLWLERLLKKSGTLPNLDEASAYMGLTEQTLRRRLKADGYPFKKLKEDARRDIAIHYLKESDQSIEVIAFRLGFSEASTFIRAFKKWTGLTPLNYRKL